MSRAIRGRKRSFSMQSPQQQDEVADLIKVLQRDINSLKAENRGTRRRALQNIEKALHNSYKKFKKKENCHRLFCAFLCQPLLHSFSDTVESCREKAIEVVTEALESDHLGNAAAASALLPVFTSVLVDRVGKVPFKETSEEVRLALVTLLKGILAIAVESAKTGEGEVLCQSIRSSLANLCDVLAALLSDKFAEVKKVCCAAAKALCTVTSESIHLHLAKLLAPLVGNLSHQHHRVRRATLQALCPIVCCARESLEKHMTESIIPAMGRLRFDGTASVRKESVAVLGSWIFGIDEELRKPFQSKILLLLLSAIGDNSAEIGALAIRTVEQCATRLREQCLENEEAPTLPEASSPKVTEFCAEELTVPGLPPLPEPFKERPSAVCRGLVQHFLPSILPDVLKDLSDWNVGGRHASHHPMRRNDTRDPRPICHHLSPPGTPNASPDACIRKLCAEKQNAAKQVQHIEPWIMSTNSTPGGVRFGVRLPIRETYVPARQSTSI